MEAAFFDLDKTVIAKAAMLALGRRFHSAGLLSRRLVARGLVSQVVFRYLGADEARMTKMRETTFRVVRGWHRDEVERLVRDALTTVIEPIVYGEALALIDAHHAAGRMVFIVSASPTEIVAPLARYLGVQHTIATRAEVDDDNRYTGRIEFYAYGANKAAALAEVAQRYDIDLANSYAYSDSITDQPLLEAVGHAVAVNPDRELRRLATERGWALQRFERPVALVTSPPPAGATVRRSGVAAGAALGVLGAVAVVYRLRRGARRR